MNLYLPLGSIFGKLFATLLKRQTIPSSNQSNFSLSLATCIEYNDSDYQIFTSVLNTIDCTYVMPARQPADRYP